jgi:SnoaL-like domain
MSDPSVSAPPAALAAYLEMWNERDPAQIRAHLDRCVAENCLWVDPLHNHTGRDRLEANVREFRASYPGAELRLASTIDGHNNRYRYEWVITVGDDLLIRGFDVTTIDDAGMIERVDGFFGVLERTGSGVPTGG